MLYANCTPTCWGTSLMATPWPAWRFCMGMFTWIRCCCGWPACCPAPPAPPGLPPLPTPPPLLLLSPPALAILHLAGEVQRRVLWCALFRKCRALIGIKWSRAFQPCALLWRQCILTIQRSQTAASGPRDGSALFTWKFFQFERKFSKHTDMYTTLHGFINYVQLGKTRFHKSQAFTYRNEVAVFESKPGIGESSWTRSLNFVPAFLILCHFHYYRRWTIAGSKGHQEYQCVPQRYGRRQASLGGIWQTSKHTIPTKSDF